MTFAQTLRQLREDARLSQSAAAELLGIGKRTLERYEAGTTEPTALAQEAALSALRAMGKVQTSGNQPKTKSK
jgi:transcriptional regulator with XRE-family HTH domain